MKHVKIEDEIEKALRKEIDFQLPEHFTDRVMQRLQEHQAITDRNPPWMLMISGLFLTLCAVVTLALYTELLQPEKFLSTSLWVISLSLLFGVIQYLDKKLIKDKMKLNQLA